VGSGGGFLSYSEQALREYARAVEREPCDIHRVRASHPSWRSTITQWLIERVRFFTVILFAPQSHRTGAHV